MRGILHYRFVIIAICCLLAGCSQAGENQRFDLLIENAQVFVGDGTVLERASIGILDNRIQWVGAAGTNKSKAKIVINAEGTTVIPGLMDAHVHLMSSEYLLDSDSLDAYMSVILPHWLKGMLLHGVTTVRTLGAPIKESLEIKTKIAEGVIEGPRIIASGPGLTSPQGHPAATMYRQFPALNKRFVRVATTTQEARAAITEVIDAGMESPLKLVYHGGNPGDDSYTLMGTPIIRLDPNVLEAAVDEAHSRGYTVSVHTNDYEDALTAVLAGVDGVEHGVVSAAIPDDRLRKAMLQRNTFLVSTLRLHKVMHGTKTYSVASDNLKLLHDGGVTVVAGSDTPVGWTYPGLYTLFEIEALVDAGLTPSEAIQAATYNAALSFGIAGRLGRIREGLLADLVIVKGNPLKNISLLRYPRYVIKDGDIVRGYE